MGDFRRKKMKVRMMSMSMCFCIHDSMSEQGVLEQAGIREYWHSLGWEQRLGCGIAG